MAHDVKALYALPKILNSGPDTHTWLFTTVTPSTSDLIPSSDLGTHTHMWYTYTHIFMNENKINIPLSFISSVWSDIH